MLKDYTVKEKLLFFINPEGANRMRVERLLDESIEITDSILEELDSIVNELHESEDILDKTNMLLEAYADTEENFYD